MKEKKRFLALAVASLAVCAVALCALGCSSGDSSSSSSSREANYDLTIGAPDDAAGSFLLDNATGANISTVQVKEANDAEYGEQLSMDAPVFENGVVAKCCFPSLPLPDEADSSDITVQVRADFRFTIEDGTSFEIHQVNPYDIEEAALRISDGIAFLEYTSIETGEFVSTFEFEQGIARENAEDAAASVTEEPAQQDSGFVPAPAESSDVQETSEPAESTPPADTDETAIDVSGNDQESEDECVGDIVLR